MCIRDRLPIGLELPFVLSPQAVRRSRSWHWRPPHALVVKNCLLYTSDAADERSSVDLGGRRIIKKKKDINKTEGSVIERHE